MPRYFKLKVLLIIQQIGGEFVRIHQLLHPMGNLRRAGADPQTIRRCVTLLPIICYFNTKDLGFVHFYVSRNFFIDIPFHHNKLLFTRLQLPGLLYYATIYGAKYPEQLRGLASYIGA